MHTRSIPAQLRRSRLAAALSLGLCTPMAMAVTIAVNTGNLTHGFGNCTLQDAVLSINQGSLISGTGCTPTGTFGSNDTVYLGNFAFSFSNQPAGGNISSGAASALVLSKPVVLLGTTDSNGKPQASIERAAGASAFRLIQTSADLTVVGVTIQGGESAVGADIGGRGGGIYAVNKNAPIVLTLKDSVVTGNMADGNGSYAGYGGGIYAAGASVVLLDSTIGPSSTGMQGNSAYWGGGVHASDGTINAIGSTITGNLAYNGYGGGLFTYGAVSLSNSTVSGNYASTGGGGISAGSVNLRFCTLAGNTVLAGQLGGGVLFTSGASMNASLLADNDPGNDVDSTTGHPVISGDYNSIGSLGSGITLSGGTHNKTGPSACSAPMPLADNGGGTRTMALVQPSNACAIDAGPVSAVGLNTDQRGPLFERRAGPATDIGAYEFQPANDRIFRDGFDP